MALPLMNVHLGYKGRVHKSKSKQRSVESTLSVTVIISRGMSRTLQII